MDDIQFEKLCDVIIACSSAIIRSNAHPNSDFGSAALDELPSNPFAIERMS